MTSNEEFNTPPGGEPLLVISPGGMACSFAIQSMERIGFLTNCPRDSDGLKHCPEPRDQRFNDFRDARKLYIWNHPLFAILSLQRRGWLLLQRRKLWPDRGKFSQSLDDLWRQTIAAGHDISGISRHFEQWHSSSPSSTFWLDFRKIEQQRFALAEFLNRPLQDFESLLLRPRNSKVPADTPSEILDIYERLDMEVCDRICSR